MQQMDNERNTPTPPLGVYGTQQQKPQPAQQPQEQGKPTGSSDDIGSGGGDINSSGSGYSVSSNSTVVLTARIILGIVCSLVIANTLRTIATSVYLSLPQSSAYVDAFDLLYMVSGIFDVFMRLMNAAPAIFLLIYAVRTQRVSSRMARIALAFWWALWLVGLGVYVFYARDAVTQDYFAQLIAWHAASALAPAAASVCVWFIQKGGKKRVRVGRADNAGNQPQVGEASPTSQAPQAFQVNLPPTDAPYKNSPRVALGIVAGIVLAGCVLGVLALVGASLEEAELANAGASGHEYLGALTDGAFGIIILIPAVPAVLCMVFACKPTRSTYVGAIVGLALWWALWVFVAIAVVPFLRIGTDAAEFLGISIGFVALAIPPAVSTLCVWLASHGSRQGECRD